MNISYWIDHIETNGVATETINAPVYSKRNPHLYLCLEERPVYPPPDFNWLGQLLTTASEREDEVMDHGLLAPVVEMSGYPNKIQLIQQARTKRIRSFA